MPAASSPRWRPVIPATTRSSREAPVPSAKSCGRTAINTSWFGKMHNVPDWMSSQAGPFDLWPMRPGLRILLRLPRRRLRSVAPALYENNRPIEPYLGRPNYILDHDLADQAIPWMRMQHALAPGKPWFLYYATGTAHAPHHAPKDWIAKYKGQFDQGWDKSPRRDARPADQAGNRSGQHATDRSARSRFRRGIRCRPIRSGSSRI